MKITLSDTYGEVIEALGDESLGILFRAIYHRVKGENPFFKPDTPADVRLAYREFEKQFETNRKRSESGKQGWKSTFADGKSAKTEDLPTAKPSDDAPIYTSIEDSNRVLNTTLLKSLDGTEDSSRKLNTTLLKASDGNNSNPVWKDKEVLAKWMEYITRRHFMGKEVTPDEAQKASTILQEKSGGDPEKAKEMLQKSIDRLKAEWKKELKPKNRTNNFFDFNERKPGDNGYKDLDAIVRSEI